jgi:branched-chain amino acid transport system substrate-binding protein
MQLMVEMLASAIEKAKSTEAAAVARALENASFSNGFHQALMRAEDHQLLQPLYVSVMQKKGDAGTRFDNEGSGYGFKTERFFESGLTALPSSCKMERR